MTNNKLMSDNKIYLSQRIIEHLNVKETEGDDLNGLVLAIYEKEMKKLSENIIKTVSDLILKEIITEYQHQNGKRYYKLVKPLSN